MPRALNKMTKGGTGYQRPPEIAAGIDAALKQDLDEQLRRANIGDPANPDYMPSECLLHLVRGGTPHRQQARGGQASAATADTVRTQAQTDNSG
jgi:hypothetical protein